jgi:tetratricopeptide (TPR) repeat protein
MGKDDWYRRKSWTSQDETAFRSRNRRSRGVASKAQYLRIQAETLHETGDIALAESALRLARECLSDYPGARMSRAPALDLAGRCCVRLGSTDEALGYFRDALEFQAEFPGIQTNACFHFARLVAEQRRKDQYDVALRSLSEFGAPVFPWHVFVLNGAKALIAADEGDLEGAKHSARAALAAAAVTDSGLGRGREAVGLVGPRERNSELFLRLRELA